MNLRYIFLVNIRCHLIFAFSCKERYSICCWSRLQQIAHTANPIATISCHCCSRHLWQPFLNYSVQKAPWVESPHTSTVTHKLFYRKVCTELVFWTSRPTSKCATFNPLNHELNPFCYLLALLGAHHFLHVSRIRVKLLTFRLLMSYIWSTHS